MKTKDLFIITAISLCLVQSVAAQSADYYGGIKKHDLSKLWYTDIHEKKVDLAEITVPEPLGFIGEQYQRFFLHYSSIAKSKSNAYQYKVTGKTKVKDNICNFSGTISIVKSGLYIAQMDHRYKQGFVECVVEIFEDSTQLSTGFIKGKMLTKFYLDEENNPQYDDLLFGADAYRNNQCEASWTSYTTHKSKKVNWGDYRIPGSKGLDIGDGEFMVANNYLNNGWNNYKTAVSGDPENAVTKRAQELESNHWWK